MYVLVAVVEWHLLVGRHWCNWLGSMSPRYLGVFLSFNPKNHGPYAQTNNLATTQSSIFPTILSGKFECVGTTTRSYAWIV